MSRAQHEIDGTNFVSGINGDGFCFGWIGCVGVIGGEVAGIEPKSKTRDFCKTKASNERYVFVTVRILAEKCATEPYEKFKKTDKTTCPCVR
jgi:hypothetical protein